MRLLKEPLLHFLVIGAALFVLFDVLNDTSDAPEPMRITVTDADVERLQGYFESTWRRPPSEAETARLVDDFVTEEVLVREATALGLDQDDAVIRQRLRQKMDFLLDAGADLAEPEPGELEAFFEDRRDAFSSSPRIAFEQVFLGSSAEAAQVGETLAALQAGADPATQGERTLIPDFIPLSVPRAIDAQFGSGVFNRLTTLEPGVWSGPVESGFGVHLVRVTEARPAVAPDLDNVRETVLAEWRRVRAQKVARDRRDALRGRYDITLPGGAS